jgi:hypothetical protein
MKEIMTIAVGVSNKIKNKDLEIAYYNIEELASNAEDAGL